MLDAVALPLWLDRPPREALEIAAIVDDLGVGELWVGEMATFDAFALAGAIARTTIRPTLTVGPLAVSLRDPVALAMGLSSVAELGGRTAHLALGASSGAVVSDWHGVDVAATPQRFTEVVEVCRSLFQGERTDFTGRTLRSRGFRLRMGHPGTRIAIAAFGPRLLTRAAQIADRVVLAHVTTDQIRWTREFVDEAADVAGRPRPELVVWTQTGYGPMAAEQIRRGLVSYLGARGYGEMFTTAGFGPLVERARAGESVRSLGDAIPRELARTVAAVGDPTEVRTALAARRRAGADRIVITPATTSEGGVAALLRDLHESA